MKISGVYKITNTITGDFYIGSSKDVKQRWRSHKKPSTWKRCKNNPMYLDFQKFGVNNFVFEILAEAEEGSLKEAEQQFIEKLKPTYNNYYANGLDKFEFQVIAEVEEGSLKEAEQQFIEKLKPTYNNINAKGLNVERRKESQKEYHKTEKYKEYNKEYQKEYHKDYRKTDKGKESQKKANNKYQNQLCSYNGETLTLRALSIRFWRQGIPHPTQEAKKYLLQ